MVKNLLLAFEDGSLVARALSEERQRAQPRSRTSNSSTPQLIRTSRAPSRPSSDTSSLSRPAASSAEDCGPRLQELAARLRDQRAHANELDQELGNQQVLQVTDELVGKVRARIERAIERRSPA